MNKFTLNFTIDALKLEFFKHKIENEKIIFTV